MRNRKADRSKPGHSCRRQIRQTPRACAGGQKRLVRHAKIPPTFSSSGGILHSQGLSAARESPRPDGRISPNRETGASELLRGEIPLSAAAESSAGTESLDSVESSAAAGSPAETAPSASPESSAGTGAVNFAGILCRGEVVHRGGVVGRSGATGRGQP